MALQTVQVRKACSSSELDGKHVLDLRKHLKAREYSITYQDKARQHDTRHIKTRQGKAKQGDARHIKTRQDKAKQDDTRHARRGKAKQSSMIQVIAKRRQGKMIQDISRQGKAR
ncbi:hypothetical protein PoB_002771200 [Plakobranchus ocellatus]|uniref:Uncharacterized protein n=1 Tax=Plakobranchus ocellatus TaxID=259542 RepID=A0AAV4A1P0_9GAST|nr:hypothetical protein PoB_002771200 [Plakobranchus ocellatus]